MAGSSFEVPEQVDEYSEAVMPPRKRRKNAAPVLPILNG
jgi:hypothetical protein